MTFFTMVPMDFTLGMLKSIIFRGVRAALATLLMRILRNCFPELRESAWINMVITCVLYLPGIWNRNYLPKKTVGVSKSSNIFLVLTRKIKGTNYLCTYVITRLIQAGCRLSAQARPGTHLTKYEKSRSVLAMFYRNFETSKILDLGEFEHDF